MYIPMHEKAGKAKQGCLREPHYIDKTEVVLMHKEIREIERSAQYKRPILNLHQRKMMQTHNLAMGELRFLLVGRIEPEHHRQLVENYVMPIAAAYGYAGEVVVEDVQLLFCAANARFRQYVKWVREDLGFTYMCPVLHLLSHGDVLVEEAGGFRTNVCRYETGIWAAGERIHGSVGQEGALLRGMATATLLSCAEHTIMVPPYFVLWHCPCTRHSGQPVNASSPPLPATLYMTHATLHGTECTQCVTVPTK